MGKKQSNDLDMSGKVISIGGVERISDKFSKRTLVMEVFSGKYANEMPFEFVNESMDQIKDVRPGEFVTVNFQLRARRTDKDGITRRFITLDGRSCYKE
jgi:hypothetical protein